jgi:hypothetical protein
LLLLLDELLFLLFVYLDPCPGLHYALMLFEHLVDGDLPAIKLCVQTNFVLYRCLCVLHCFGSDLGGLQASLA